MGTNITFFVHFLILVLVRLDANTQTLFVMMETDAQQIHVTRREVVFSHLSFHVAHVILNPAMMAMHALLTLALPKVMTLFKVPHFGD